MVPKTSKEEKGRIVCACGVGRKTKGKDKRVKI